MVVYEVLRLLRACHAAGILHGDVKPSNFLLASGNPLCPGAACPAPPSLACCDHFPMLDSCENQFHLPPEVCALFSHTGAPCHYLRSPIGVEPEWMLRQGYG